MQITDVKIRKLIDDDRLKAVVSISVDNELAVHDIKVIESGGKLFAAMPSKKDHNGSYRDTVHPITRFAIEKIETAVLTAYKLASDDREEQQG
ncbi:MAG: SpoVG family protein [Ruminococcus sp.]|nr:SpoVG family protein [Ruminococcus sp.]